jgi:transcriptional regulator with XRE-family HTH domain
MERAARRTSAALAGARETQALSASLGGEVRTSRRLLRMTQEALGARVGLRPARIGEIERGEGATASLATWISLGIALERPLAISLSRRSGGELKDAGHLAIQELVLRLARESGYDASLELPVGRAWHPFSIDVVLRDRPRRTLVLDEIWNRLDDFGAALRNHDRKVDELERLALLQSGDGPSFRVAACWVMRATAANRAIVARYPEVIRTRFPGSSRAWLKCLVHRAPAPLAPGLVWADVGASRLFEVRAQPKP